MTGKWVVIYLGMNMALAAVMVIGLILAWRWVAIRLERDLGRNPKGTLWEFLFSLNANSRADLALTMQRAEQGKPAEHPLGSVPDVMWLDHIGFDPATLHPVPKDRTTPVNLAVRLGPKAATPLPLSLPILIAPMGYGVALSEEAKIALAQAASLTDTAIVSGEGPFLPEERAFATKWVLQWSRAEWAHQEAVVQLADMVEIQMGQGSEAGIGIVKNPQTVPARVADAAMGPVVIHAISPQSIPRWIEKIRHIKSGCPIGIKLPANQHLEQDLHLVTQWGVDVITLDGSAAGSAGSPAVISDHFGLDVALAIHRAHRWLTQAGVRQQVSLVASGGIHDAADVAKVLALGADAAAIGSTLLFALSHEQVAEHLPGSPPTAVVMAHGQASSPPQLDLDKASEHVTAWFEATRAELTLLCQALGVDCIQDLGPQHLVARTSEAARRFDIASDGEPVNWGQVKESLGELADHYEIVNDILGRVVQKIQT